MVSTGMEMIAGGVALAVVGIAGGEIGRLHPGAISGRSLAGLAYLITGGSWVGFLAYVWLLRNVKTSIVSTYAYVNPLVAVLLGWAILDERVTATTGLAGAIIVASVAAIVASSGGAPRSPGEVARGERPDLGAEEIPA